MSSLAPPLKALSCLVLSYPVLPNTRQNTHKPFETLYSRLLIAVHDIIIFELVLPMDHTKLESHKVRNFKR
jgi:hypothetical protein